MRYLSRRLFARRSCICICIQYRTYSAAQLLRKPKNNNLPDTPARTRFAPSPTGYLHVGSLRTALFNYLFARRTGGQFLLRIEDTDQKRTIPGTEQRLYEDLQWAGLQWDEGPIIGGPNGPYRQSERTALYRSHANDLVSHRHAYRCFCTAEQLDTFARHRSERGLPPGYDGKCRGISAEESEERVARGEAHVFRLKVEDEYPMFHDLVYGMTGQDRSKQDLLDRVYDDPILLKSDGHPTYHLANVVDDHCMNITHVIRGTEWMASTPMHVALYNAFNWTPPQFAHVPLLFDKTGQKISKRDSAIGLSSFRDEKDVFPATLVNFAALLGWSHTQKSDVFSLKELEQVFNLKITRGPTVVAFEKLWFLQKAHAQRFATSGGPEFEQMVNRVCSVVEDSGEELSCILQNRTLRSYITSLLLADAKSYTNAKDFVKRNSTFFTTTLNRPPYHLASSSSSSFSSSPSTALPILQALHTTAAALTLVPASHWTADTHRKNINDASAPNSKQEPSPSPAAPANKLFRKELYHYLRWALSASAPGPGIPETMAILGREETVRRLQDARDLTAEFVSDAKETK